MIRKTAMPPRKSGISRGSGIKKKRRPKDDNLRIYGGNDRIEFVQALPCCWCGRIGATENAHTVTGGTGRKADAKEIAPLCGIDLSRDEIGCHKRYDQHLEPFDREDVRDYVKAQAAETERAWLAVAPPSYLHTTDPLCATCGASFRENGDQCASCVYEPPPRDAA